MSRLHAFWMLHRDEVDGPPSDADGLAGQNDPRRMDELVVAIELRNSRLAPPVACEPAVVLRAWRVVRATSGACYLVGYLDGTDTVRFTTKIASIEPATRRVTTSSGRIYQLHGAPTVDPVLLLAMAARAASQRLGTLIDASETVWTQFERATQ